MTGQAIQPVTLRAAIARLDSVSLGRTIADNAAADKKTPYELLDVVYGAGWMLAELVKIDPTLVDTLGAMIEEITRAATKRWVEIDRGSRRPEGHA